MFKGINGVETAICLVVGSLGRSVIVQQKVEGEEDGRRGTQNDFDSSE